MPSAFYNDLDPFAAAWLAELQAEGVISPGDISTTSIKELSGHDVDGYQRAHFFAGIGGWDAALAIAGWPDDRPVWTGSCPCQPFSAAGKRAGAADPRHLWPDFARIIDECRPPVIFGEQVASADGRNWLAGVRADLEALGYAVGAADLCSAGIGAPHIRQRLYWVAHGNNAGPQRRRIGWERADECSARPTGLGRAPLLSSDPRRSWRLVACRDGRIRRIPVEPAIFPLADGVPNRVGTLRGAGNSIDPFLAAEFVAAFMDAEQCPAPA